MEIKKNLLTPYHGRLSPEMVANGINAANHNANRLLNDAKILFDAGSFPTAASLAILAIEETGKASILRGIAVSKSNDDIKQGWKDYRNHKAKNAHWIFLEPVKRGAKFLEDFHDATDKSGEHTQLLDTLKQLGFYTDFFQKNHCSQPTDVIDADFAKDLIKIAEIFCRRETITKREIELWIEYLGPTWVSKSYTEMAAALVKWTEAMTNEGIGKYSPEKMLDFVTAQDKAN